MGMNKTRGPEHAAPDWVGKTYGARVADCIVHLTLFEIITEDEARRLFARVDKWREEHRLRGEQSNAGGNPS